MACQIGEQLMSWSVLVWYFLVITPGDHMALQQVGPFDRLEDCDQTRALVETGLRDWKRKVVVAPCWSVTRGKFQE
jgi:hypothetical protein